MGQNLVSGALDWSEQIRWGGGPRKSWFWPTNLRKSKKNHFFSVWGLALESFQIQVEFARTAEKLGLTNKTRFDAHQARRTAMGDLMHTKEREGASGEE